MLYFEVFYIFKSIFWGPVIFIGCFSKHSSSLISYHASLLLNESRLRSEGGQLTHFLGGYVCQMTQNCDPKL